MLSSEYENLVRKFLTMSNCSNISSLKGHLINSCPGAPYELKDEFLAGTDPRRSYRYGQYKNGKKDPETQYCSYSSSDDDTDEDINFDDQDDGGANKQPDETERAVKILTRLIDDRKTGEERVGKPLELLSEEELDREIKELKAKKIRTEITLMNDTMVNNSLLNQERSVKIKLFNKINHDYERIMDRFVGKREAGDNVPTGDIIVDGTSVECTSVEGSSVETVFLPASLDEIKPARGARCHSCPGPAKDRKQNCKFCHNCKQIVCSDHQVIFCNNCR